MARLTEQELEQYKALRIEGDPFFTRNLMLSKLVNEERKLKATGADYGLPYHAARRYHIEGRPMDMLLYDIGVSGNSTIRIFDHYGIPREKTGPKRKPKPERQETAAQSLGLTDSDTVAIKRLANRLGTQVGTHDELVDRIADITKLNRRKIDEYVLHVSGLTREQVKEMERT